jgi:hypothetical protein
MAITKFPSAAVSADGRTLIRGAGASATRDVLTVAIYGTTLGGGTASLLISHQDAPSLSTAGDWATIDGASSLSLGTAYRIEIAGAAIAFYITGSTNPSITVAWS